MSILVEVPSALQKYTGDNDEIHLEGSSVQEVFDALSTQYPELKMHLYDDQGKVRSFINVYVNDEDIRYGEKMNTPLKDGDEIQIIPSIAGGSAR